MSLTVALTGATGFIGRRLVALLVSRGWQVRALVRDPQRAASLPELAGPQVELVAGSLEDSASLKQLVSNVDAVVHCAGSVRGINYADFARVNVAGLENILGSVLAGTAKDGAPPRLLTLSSLAAREPQLSDYAASKRAGEQRLVDAAKANDALQWLALRPPAVYGPGDKELLPLFQAMQRGLAPVVGERRGRFSMLYVDDLADAIENWLSQGQDGGETVSGVFELHDGRKGGYNWDELLAMAAELRGGPVRALPVPRWLLLLFARVNLGLSRVFGYAPMLSPGKVNELRHPDWVVDDRALDDALCWRPQVQFAEGLRRTLIQ